MHLFPSSKRGAVLRRSISLCAALLVAGCASTGTNFDESRLSEIRKGETTEAQLVGLFGQPESRSINSENVTTLAWVYAEARVKGESFIPYAGAFMGGTRSKSKTLTVLLAEDKVTGYTFSGGGSESRQMTQETPKK